MLRIHKSKKFFENDVLYSYDGREDTDMSVWFNERFLNDKFDRKRAEFRLRMANGQIVFSSKVRFFTKCAMPISWRYCVRVFS